MFTKITLYTLQVNLHFVTFLSVCFQFFRLSHLRIDNISIKLYTFFSLDDKDSDGKEKKSKSKEKDKKKEPASMFQINEDKNSKSKKKGDCIF